MADLDNEVDTDEAPELTEDQKNDMLAEILDKVGRAQSVSRDERKLALQDRRFSSILGAQWEGNFEQQFQNKPRFEVNKIQLSVTRIYNEYRANRISVEFIPKDGEDNPQLSDVCAGLYRADEEDGGGEEAFDNAFGEGLNGGIGGWRLRTVYVRDDDESDEQRIIFEPITDADSCLFFDLDAKKQDKSDAKWGALLTAYSRKDYEDENEDDASLWAPSSFPKYITENYNDWLTPDVVFLCSFYRVEEVSTPYVWYTGLNGDERKFKESDVDADKKKELAATGFKRTKKKSIKVRRVRKFVCSAGKIIEDGGYIAGKEIPLVPFYGKRWYIDNVERTAGHVRYAKDAQRLKNMQLSKLGEVAAFGSVSKPILTPEQVRGHVSMWSRDNVENYPYLLVNALMGADGITPAVIGPQSYTKSPEIPQALAALLQLTEQDMQDILGNQEAGEQVQANQSGVAVELVQEKLDMQSYIYISNFEKAMGRSGDIWLSMAKDVYIEPNRKMKTKDLSGKYGKIELKAPVIDERTDTPTTGNDISEANFNCRAKAGPSTTSRRAAITKMMAGLLQFVQDPGTVSIIISMLMMNIEGEGIDDVRKFFRQKLLQMGVVTPTPDEQKQLQAAASQQQPDPQTTYLNAAAAEAQATAASKVADMELTAAKIELTKAQAAAAVKGMQTTDIENNLKVIDTLTAAQEAQANAASAHADAAQTNATPPPAPASPGQS